jgi:hypothetical protein
MGMSDTGEIVAEALRNVSTKYVCDICGEEHDSEQQAARCAVSCRENPYLFKRSDSFRHRKQAGVL